MNKFFLFIILFSSQYVFALCGTVDDTADIQALIDANLFGNVSVELPVGECRVSSLNLTNRQGVKLSGQGIATKIIPIQSGVNVIDLTGSSHITLSDFRICGFCDQTVVPHIGILNAQAQENYASDVTIIDRVRVDGNFSLAAYFNLSVQSSAISNSQFYNYQPNSITAILTGNNFFGANSQFANISSKNDFRVSDWTFTQVELHNFGNTWALWLGGVHSLRIYGGNMSSNASMLSNNAVVLNGQTVFPNYIKLDGTTFYVDFPQNGVPACAVSGHLSSIHFEDNESTPMPLTGC